MGNGGCTSSGYCAGLSMERTGVQILARTEVCAEVSGQPAPYPTQPK